MAYSYDLKSSSTGRTYRAEFEKEPSPEDINATISHFDEVYDRPSELGSAVRGATRSALPAFAGGRAGGAVGSRLGAVLGGALTGAVEGSEVPIWGNLIGALVGAGVGMWGTEQLQTHAADYLNPSANNPFSTASQQKDITTNPIANELGGFLLFKPNPIKLGNALRSVANPDLIRKGYKIQKELYETQQLLNKEIPANATKEWLKKHQLAADATLANVINQDPQAYKAFHDVAGVGGNVSVGAAMGLIQGEDDAPNLLKGAALGSLFNDEWIHGVGPKPYEDFSKPQSTEKVSDVQSGNDIKQRSEAGEAPAVSTLGENLDAPASTYIVNAEASATQPKQEVTNGKIDRTIEQGTTLQRPPDSDGGRENANEGNLQGKNLQAEAGLQTEQEGVLKTPPSSKEDSLSKAVSVVEQAKSDPSVSASTAAAESILKNQIGELPPQAESVTTSLPGSQSTEAQGAAVKAEQEVPPATVETPKERIVASAWKDHNGEIHLGHNHKQALRNAGIEIGPYESKSSRETPDFGFIVKDDKGNTRFVSREEAETIGQSSGQIEDRTPRLKDKGLHSTRVKDLEESISGLEEHEKPTTPQEAKFKNGKEARKSWELEGQKDVKETLQEYMNRKLCA